MNKSAPFGVVGIDQKRELLVLELAAEGKTSAEIASELFISRRTAEAHRANLMKKLGLNCSVVPSRSNGSAGPVNSSYVVPDADSGAPADRSVSPGFVAAFPCVTPAMPSSAATSP